MKKLFEVTGVDLYPTFLALRDKPHNARRKQILEELWEEYEPFADRNFPSAFAYDPHPRFWEMYLACGLLDLAFEMLPASQRGETGPDICLLHNGQRIWIEAIAPTGGTGPDAVLDPPSNKAFLVPEKEIVLRLCSGVIEKRRKLDEYTQAGIVGDQEPFAIALGSAALPGPFLADEIPYAVQAVYPVGNFQIMIDPRTMVVVSSHYERREAIRKLGGAMVPTNAFLSREFSGVSGLIFSDAGISQIDSHRKGELSFVQNFTGRNALPRGWLRTGDEWWWEPEGKIMRLPIGPSP